MNENGVIERRDDDEIINRPVIENRYDITASLCGYVFNHRNGNNVAYEEIKDFENSTFPLRRLYVSINDTQIFNVLNYKKDKNGMIDVTLLVHFDDTNNLIKNKPFSDGKFKAILKEGDFNISIKETINSESISKKSDIISRRTVTLYLFREDEIDAFDIDNINFLLKDGVTLQNLLIFIFNKFTKYKFLISKPDHNPIIGNFLMPQVSLNDALKIIDTDIGIYKTDYMLFLNDGVLYFLNKDNNFNCRNSKLEFSVNILLSKPGEDLKNLSVDKLTNGNFTVILRPHQVEITKSVSKRTEASTNYIFPNGKKIKHKNNLSRDIKTVRKITNIEPLDKYNDRIKEEIVVKLDNIAFQDINPLSTIFFTDSQNKRREYRISKTNLSIVSRRTVDLTIKAFRILQEGEKI